MRHARRRPGLPLMLPLLLAAALLLAAGSGFLLLSRWIKSEECHALLESKASEALSGKAEFGPLEWLWVGVASPRLKATINGGEGAHTLEAGNVRAHLRPAALLQGCWAVEEIAMEKARLHFAAAAPDHARKDASAGTRSGATTGRFSWMPAAVVVEAIRSGHTDLLFDLPEGKMLELLETKLEVFPGKEDLRLEARGGRLIWTRFPGFQPELLWARGRLRDGRLRLNGAEMGFSGGGSAEFEGAFPDKDDVSRIGLHCKGLPIGNVFPSASSMLGGTLTGEGRASWTPSELRSMEGRVTVEEASVHGVPALDELAAFTGMEQFRNLSLKKASANFARIGNVTRWRDIVLEAPGLIKVTGEAEVADAGSLSGTLQVGVTTDIVRVIPMAKELLSAEERDGYFWMPLHVGGSLEHPTEDLRPRLITAVAAKASGMIRGGLDEGLKILGIRPGSTNAPAPTLPPAATNAVRTLEKSAGSVIDAVGGFLK